MRAYILRRIALAVPVLLGVSALAFLLLHLIPGDVAQVLLGQDATAEALQKLRANLGLDRPLPVQFLEWLGRVLTGDLGASLRSGRAILPDILDRFSVTAQLTALAAGLAWLVSVPLGVTAALRRNTPVDLAASVMALLGISVPNFALGTVLILALSLGLRWFPPVGFVSFWTDPARWLSVLALPAVTLAAAMGGAMTRMTRSAMLDALGQEYVRAARAKGLSARVVVYRHALRNALIPVVTVAGMQVGYLLGGAVIVEELFSLPGLGRLVLTAINQRDYPVVQGAVLFIAATFVAVNLAVDVLYARLDPRIRY